MSIGNLGEAGVPVSQGRRTTAARGHARLGAGQEHIVFGIAVLLIVIFGTTLHGFASVGNVLALLRSISVLGILALGMAIVVIGRGIDLSQIVVLSVANGIAVMMLNHGVPMSIALPAGLLLALLLGLFNGFVIAYVEVPALFTTLASGLLILGVARVTVLTSLVINLPESHPLLVLGRNLAGIPVPLLVFLAATLLVHVFLAHTTPGRFVYAHGDNTEAARLNGIAVRRLTLMEYALCSAIGYLGGLVTVGATALVNLNAAVNSTQIFDVILVVVLGGVSLVGGRGGVLSVMAGTLLIGVLLNGMTIMDMNYQLQNVIKGAVLLAAIVLDNWLHPRDEETARQGD